MNRLRLLLKSVIFIFSPLLTSAQFPPPAGQDGSTAIHKDSSKFINWAKTCSVQVGYINIADTSKEYGGSNKANYGIDSDAVGIADDHVISLGDGGIATLTFDPPIKNGDGFDFAVFENGLNNEFLELAFVEVSSDGSRFVTFPSISLTQEQIQIPTFGSIDATKIYNLAGKYRLFFGSPFDLDEIKDSSGINVMHITHVRIRDVVGCVHDSIIDFVSFDSQGHRINDPWPTEFHTGGFDLDAVGVIHELSQSIEDHDQNRIQIYPNPVKDKIHVDVRGKYPVTFELLNLFGEVVIRYNIFAASAVDLTVLYPGLYFGKFTCSDGRIETRKILKR